MTNQPHMFLTMGFRSLVAAYAIPPWEWVYLTRLPLFAARMRKTYSMQIKYISTSARSPSLLGKVVALIAMVALGVVVLMFSATGVRVNLAKWII